MVNLSLGPSSRRHHKVDTEKNSACDEDLHMHCTKSERPSELTISATNLKKRAPAR